MNKSYLSSLTKPIAFYVNEHVKFVDNMKFYSDSRKQHIVNANSDSPNSKKNQQTSSTGDAASSKMLEKNRSNVITNPKNRKSDPVEISEPVRHPLFT